MVKALQKGADSDSGKELDIRISHMMSGQIKEKECSSLRQSKIHLTLIAHTFLHTGGSQAMLVQQG